MRIPIILALIVVITLPKDVQGFAHDMQSQFQVATVSIGKFLDRNRDDGTVQVADASSVLKTKHDTAKNSVGNIR